MGTRNRTDRRPLLEDDDEQAEIAATVFYAARHLVANGETTATEGDVLAAVKQWKRKRNPKVRDEDIAVAIRNLNVLGWLNTRPSPDLPLPQAAAVEA